jgi:hypothetical protein
MKLELPQNLISPGSLKSMRPKDKDECIQKLLLEILELNSQGITIAELMEQTRIHRNTLTGHMKTIVATREAYELKRGKLSVYYKNGKVVHAKSTECRFNDRFYKFFRLKNEQGNFVYVQERQMDEFRAIKVNGGIMIKDEDFLVFLKELQKFGMEVSESESEHIR